MIIIPVFCTGLFLTACGSANPSVVKAAQMTAVEIQDKGSSGIVLARAEKTRQTESDKNFESAHDYSNFEKRIMEISRLTDPNNE